MNGAIALAAIVGVGAYYLSKTSKNTVKEQPKIKVDNRPVPNSRTVYEPPIFIEDNPNDSNDVISYSRKAIGEKLLEQKFDIGISNGKWVFTNAPLTGAHANVAHVAGAITQYRNGQFYWNATGKHVDWNGYEDRKHIIELLRYS